MRRLHLQLRKLYTASSIRQARSTPHVEEHGANIVHAASRIGGHKVPCIRSSTLLNS